MVIPSGTVNCYIPTGANGRVTNGRNQKGPDGNYHVGWFNDVLWGNLGFFNDDYWGDGGGRGGGGGGGGGGSYHNIMGTSSSSILSQMGFGQSFGQKKNGDYGFWSSRIFDPSVRGYTEAGRNGNTLAEVSVGSERTWTPFPSFATLLSNYPLPYDIRPDRSKIDRNQPLDDVTGDNFRYFNQCAIRVSIALSKSGVDLRGAKNITNPGGQTYASGNIVGASNLANFIKNNLLIKPTEYDGTKVDVASLISNKTGILYFQNFVEDENGRSNSNTHMELWNKDHYMSTFPFTQMFDATKIWFWEIK